MREIADKAYRIREQEGDMSGRFDPPHRGIQRREEHIGLEDLFAFVLAFILTFLEQCIHDSGLARIGVADQGDSGQTGPKSAAALCRALPLHDIQFAPELGDPFFDPAPVQFQLLLTGALIGETSAASALTGEGGTHSDQPGQHILETGGFDLQFCLPCPRP